MHQALTSLGQPLDSATRAFMEPRFGVDLGSVRIHTGPQAAESAQAVGAQAYTVGPDVFFGADRYKPDSREGKRLLAHELSHTVQQSGAGAGARLSSAARGVYRDPTPPSAPAPPAADTETKKPKTDQVTITVPPELLQYLLWKPPSLLTPQPQTLALSPGSPSLLPPPSQYVPSTPTPLAPVSPATPALTPAGPGTGPTAPTTAPKAPDRLSFYDIGPLSFGARFGFPDMSKETKPGDPPSAMQESLKKAEIMNFQLTGQPPSEYSLDPGKMVGALWGIFSTQIAPDVARKISAGLASKSTGSGVTYQLDATLLLNLGGDKKGGGGGATLTVNF